MLANSVAPILGFAYPSGPMDTPIETAPETASPGKRPNLLRRLYAWTLKWAETKHAIFALACISFIESSFFPIPPDVLLLAICFAHPKLWIKAAFYCTIASVLGGMLGYAIGLGLWETVGAPIVQLYHGEAIMDKIQGWYDAYGFVGILVAAITPIPYKVFTIASGLFAFPFLPFVLASFIGRGFRFFMVAGLVRWGGEKLRPMIEKRLELFFVIFTVLGILGFIALKVLR